MWKANLTYGSSDMNGDWWSFDHWIDKTKRQRNWMVQKVSQVRVFKGWRLISRGRDTNVTLASKLKVQRIVELGKKNSFLPTMFIGQIPLVWGIRYKHVAPWAQATKYWNNLQRVISSFDSKRNKCLSCGTKAFETLHFMGRKMQGDLIVRDSWLLVRHVHPRTYK